MIREFHLSSPGKGGVSCDADGAFIGAIPVLNRLRKNGRDEWHPRNCKELSKQIGEHYGLPVDMSSKTGGLRAIANALNEGDVARAQIVTVLLGIPDLPRLSERVCPRDQMIKLIRDLDWSGMLKWDADKHPRWPAGSADSKGGEFAPKGEGGETAAPLESQSNVVDRTNSDNTGESRDEPRRGTSDDGSDQLDAASRNARIQLADIAMSDASDDPVAEAVARAAAAAQRDNGDAPAHTEPAGSEHENFFQAFGSRLSHDVKSALWEIGQAEATNSNNNLAMATDQANTIARGLKAYTTYRAQPWLDDDGHPVEIPAIDIGNPVAGQGELMARLAANLPLTRPATNADWIDPLISLASVGAGPTLRLMGPAAEVFGEVAVPVAESDILIGNSGFHGFGEFTDAVTSKYQALYDEGYANVIDSVSQGLLPNDPLVIGSKTDLFARTGLRDWLTSVEGIDEGPGQIIRVNRRLYDPAGSGDYRVPDAYIPGSRTILDGSLQFKNSSVPQIDDYQTFSGGANTIIIRPSTAPSDVIAGSYGIVY